MKTAEPKIIEQDGKTIKIYADGRVSVETIFTEPSLTKQEFADETNANNIIAKYQRTGEITHRARQAGVYADVSEIGDYKSSLEKVIAANDAFDTLPSSLRERFHNDPAELINFLQDPSNYEEGIKLGLYEPKTQTHQTPTQPQPNTSPTTNPTKPPTPSPSPSPQPSAPPSEK